MIGNTEFSRFIPMEGSINFRDFGGYKTLDGRQVKWRHLFRSGSLSMLSSTGTDVFGALNISVICDLRRKDEASMGMAPPHAPFHCRQHIPIAPGSNQMLRESIQDSTQTAADRVRFMTQITRELAGNHQLEYRELFEHLLAAKDGFLLHCSAGKDRTGFGAALILAALGVDETTIMQDYLLTNEAACLHEFMHTRMRDQYGEHFDDASMDAVSGVRAAYLEAAFDEIQSNHGSLDAFLESIGINPTAKQILQSRLLYT